MSEKTKNQKILLFVPSRPISRNQFCRLMVGFRVDGHIYILGNIIAFYDVVSNMLLSISPAKEGSKPQCTQRSIYRVLFTSLCSAVQWACCTSNNQIKHYFFFISLHSGFLSLGNTFVFRRRSRKFFGENLFFKQLDAALVGVVHWVTANSRQSAKLYFLAIHESFLQRKKPAVRYSLSSNINFNGNNSLPWLVFRRFALCLRQQKRRCVSNWILVSSL